MSELEAKLGLERAALVVELVIIYSHGARAPPIALPRQARRPASSACRRRGLPRRDWPFCAELAVQARRPVRSVTGILQVRPFLLKMRRRQCADAADSTNFSIFLVILFRQYLHDKMYFLNVVTRPMR